MYIIFFNTPCICHGIASFQQNDGDETWEQTQERRVQTMRHHCTDYAVNNDTGMMSWLRQHHALMSHILVSDKYRALYCYVPKAACTNWKRAFLLLNEQVETVNEARQKAHHMWGKTTLTQYNIDDALYRIQNYSRFIFVRDPLTRVLSSYREKFASDRRGRHTWTKRLGNAIFFQYGNHSLSRKMPQNGYNVSFQEFVRYLGDKRARFDLPGSEHWRSMVDICYPCQMNYEAIGKFETFETDVKQVLRSVFGRSDLESVVLQKSDHATDSSNRDRMREYFSALTRSEIKGLKWRYKHDGRIFGYKPWSI